MLNKALLLAAEWLAKRLADNKGAIVTQIGAAVLNAERSMSEATGGQKFAFVKSVALKLLGGDRSGFIVDTIIQLIVFAIKSRQKSATETAGK